MPIMEIMLQKYLYYNLFISAFDYTKLKKEKKRIWFVYRMF